MSGLGGLQALLVPMQTPPAGMNLRPGQPVPGIVTGTAGNLMAQVGRVQVPLGDLPALRPGQSIFLELVPRGEGYQLRVTPQPTPGQAPAQGPGNPLLDAMRQGAQRMPGTETAPPTPGGTASVAAAPTQPAESAATSQAGQLGRLVASTLQSLGQSLGGADAARLVPPFMPLNQAAVRTLLALFSLRGSAGDDLQRLQQLVTRAADAGAVPRAMAGDVARLLGELLVPADTRDLAGILRQRVFRQTAQRQQTSLEARLAQALAENDPERIAAILEGDVRGRLARLRTDPALNRFLESQGLAREFQGAAERVLERLAGAQMQNTRGIEHAYHFMEIPVAADEPFSSIQMHVFGEGEGRGRRFDRNTNVVLDLSTTRLGDLWINLTLSGGEQRACLCAIRTTAAAAAHALANEADTLVSALRDAGYPQAQVRVEQWDGDRLRETAHLMRRFARVELEA